MKSKLFSRFDPTDKDNEQFLKDLQQAVRSTPQELDTLLGALSELMDATTNTEMEAIFKRLEDETGLSTISLSNLRNITNFFIRQMDDADIKNDAPENWVSDLIDLQILTEDSVQNFLNFIKVINEKAIPEIVQNEGKFI